ncbi:Protein kinase-like domain [Pseudocohnilembus persalinus]|uniref:Protein kinase-like domain n=1 Tax=Pseudocohnilembus persalinus TaxID=266149 RepID=A0A0V0QBH4_PSEPJ|nr:Protein kinase-like domain [Pseudocohnilembus persalinus]|eukprot:KRW99514.1 Protein kinase-like domain [Pseudocohnilembus persalinus]
MYQQQNPYHQFARTQQGQFQMYNSQFQPQQQQNNLMQNLQQFQQQQMQQQNQSQINLQKNPLPQQAQMQPRYQQQQQPQFQQPQQNQLQKINSNQSQQPAQLQHHQQQQQTQLPPQQQQQQKQQQINLQQPQQKQQMPFQRPQQQLQQFQQNQGQNQKQPQQQQPQQQSQKLQQQQNIQKPQVPQTHLKDQIIAAATQFCPVEEIDDDSLGNIKVYRLHPYMKYAASKNITLQTGINYQEIVNFRYPGIIYAIKFETDGKKAKVFFEYDFQTVRQIINQRQKKGFLYPEHEVWIYIKNLVGSLKFLQEKNIFHGDLNTNTVYFDDEYLMHRVYNNLLLNQQYDGYKKFYQGEIAYLAPELVQCIRVQEQLHTGYNFFKSDVFSAGMTILELCTLEDSGDCYDLDNKTIKYDIVQERMIKVQERYSNKLVNILSKFLEPDFKQRNDWKQMGSLLAEKQMVEFINQCHDKNSQWMKDQEALRKNHQGKQMEILQIQLKDDTPPLIPPFYIQNAPIRQTDEQKNQNKTNLNQLITNVKSLFNTPNQANDNKQFKSQIEQVNSPLINEKYQKQQQLQQQFASTTNYQSQNSQNQQQTNQQQLQFYNSVQGIPQEINQQQQQNQINQENSIKSQQPQQLKSPLQQQDISQSETQMLLAQQEQFYKQQQQQLRQNQLRQSQINQQQQNQLNPNQKMSQSQIQSQQYQFEGLRNGMQKSQQNGQQKNKKFMSASQIFERENMFNSNNQNKFGNQVQKKNMSTSQVVTDRNGALAFQKQDIQNQNQQNPLRQNNLNENAGIRTLSQDSKLQQFQFNQTQQTQQQWQQQQQQLQRPQRGISTNQSKLNQSQLNLQQSNLSNQQQYLVQMQQQQQQLMQQQKQQNQQQLRQNIQQHEQQFIQQLDDKISQALQKSNNNQRNYKFGNNMIQQGIGNNRQQIAQQQLQQQMIPQQQNGLQQQFRQSASLQKGLRR